MTAFRSHRGFTLIELVMIIIVVGIVAVYAAPRFGSLSTYNLTRASNELVQAIRFAQEGSMNRVDSSFQLVSGGADIFRVREYMYSITSTQEVSSPLTGASPFIANAGEWSGITTSSLNLSFDTRGYPCATVAPCSNPMTTTQTITLIAAGETRIITIEPITGFVYAN